MSLGLITQGTGPHVGQRLVRAGAPLDRADTVLLMLHGRGGSPEDMLGLADHLALPDVAVIAPTANGQSWWPNSFLAPLAQNEPGLSSGVAVVTSLIGALVAIGVQPMHIALAGFSQGACLAAEVAARHPVPLRAVAILSGGLLGNAEAGGPPMPELYGHADKTFDYDGRLDNVPVLLGVHERDPHIPLARVRRSADVLTAMGADITTQVMPGAGHGIVAEEVAWLRGQLNGARP